MSVYLDLRLLLAPTKAPTNLEIEISSATMAYAMWTGIPNDVQSAQGKLIGYKVSSDYFTSNGEFSSPVTYLTDSDHQLEKVVFS